MCSALSSGGIIESNSGGERQTDWMSPGSLTFCGLHCNASSLNVSQADSAGLPLVLTLNSALIEASASLPPNTSDTCCMYERRLRFGVPQERGRHQNRRITQLIL